MLNIVLCEPEIPQNTGNISRTCAALGASLHLIHPLGFSVDDAATRRAGLDYWQHLDLHHHASLQGFFDSGIDPAQMWYLSTKAGINYVDATFTDPCYLMFGKETAGLPDSLLEQNPERCLRIPMREGIRSLNLSNAVAILAYEVMRQKNFPGLSAVGKPNRAESSRISALVRPASLRGARTSNSVAAFAPGRKSPRSLAFSP